MTAYASISITQRHHADRSNLLFWASVAALVLATIGLQSALDFNHDVAWIVLTAQWVLDGGEIGRDIIDLNPPLVWWLSTVPVAVARGLGIGLAGASIMITLGLCVTGVVLSRPALGRLFASGTGRDRFLLFAAAILLLAPGYDFGQREHHFLIAALPYLIAASRAAEGKPVGIGLGIAIGLFSAIGFCLKPYFLLLPILAELAVLVRTRRILATIRPETLALPIVGVAYLAAVIVWAPAYLSEALPDAVGSYWAYDSSVLSVAIRMLLAGVPVAVGLVLLGRPAFAERILPQFLLLGALAAAGAAFYQLKGWPYHLLPAVGLGCMAGAAACFAAYERRRWSPRTTAALIVLAIAAWAKPAVNLRDASAPQANQVERMTAMFREEAGANGLVYAFATSGRSFTPAMVAAGVNWAAPVGGPYLLPAAVRAEGRPEGKALQKVADRQLALILHSLERREPAVIAFDNKEWKLGYGGRRFSYVDYLQRYPGYRRLLSRYTERAPVGDFRIFVRTHR